ncbi:MAG: 4Fe-4S dicluster domain-containing protein [Syntrophaceae bacterium]|nr:4Fe-4S dicluster domain-containing protein [Syntrophaceae bacterium]
MYALYRRCVGVCPSGALYHNQYGFVSYDKDKCIGCGYCSQYCPFDVPHLDASRVSGVGKITKCTLCTTPGLDRLSIGQEPACVKTCPTGVLIYGDRDELIAEGRRRVAALKSDERQLLFLDNEQNIH